MTGDYMKMKNKRLPKDTNSLLYVEDTYFLTMQDLFDKAREKWGNIGLADLNIRHEHIQVKCFGYDQYDPSDYEDYFVISKNL